MKRREGAEHLERQIGRSHAVSAQIRAAAQSDCRLERLQRWQQARLKATYADLEARPRYRAACRFFLQEIYGGRDADERDRQLERALPIMRRMLPGYLLHAVGEAMRLQAISLEFDLALARHIEGPLDQPAYARGYRAMEAWEAREEQIELIGALGRLLDATVQHRFVHQLVGMMGGPARVAGFGTLHGFLERGLDAFAAMEGADEFIGTILSRERQALKAMREGSDWPFEPWLGRAQPPGVEGAGG